MMFTTALALSMLSAVFASPQIYGPPAGGGGGGGGASAPATTTAAASNAAPSAPPDTPGNMNIDVAFQSTFTFHPANITAPNGTIVTFWFPNAGLAHSVTQSSFEAPCTYLAASSNSSAGFSSGLVEGVQFSINITDDTTPIWFHCEQVTHCGLGMVGSINAPSSGNTFSAFQQAAMAIGSNEPVESTTTAITGGVGAIATAGPTSSAAASSSSSGTSSTSDAKKLSVSAGVGLFAVAAGILVM